MFNYLILFLFLFSFTVIACNDEPVVPPDEELPVEVGDIDDLPPNIPYVLPDISDEELENFAKINYRAARRDLDPETDPQEYRELIEEAELTMARYREIYVAIEREPWLRVELQAVMDELHEEQDDEH